MITGEKRMTYQYSFFIYSSMCEVLVSFKQQRHTDCGKTHNYNVTQNNRLYEAGVHYSLSAI
jgi:hypothetical protein